MKTFSKVLKNIFLSAFSLAIFGCIEDPLGSGSAVLQPQPILISQLDLDKIPKPDHTVIVILENHAINQIIDKSAAPYINSLAESGALFTESYGLTHPSQPNYMLFFSGSNQGITDDNQPKNIPFSTPNLASSLINAKYTFKGYSEDLPYVGFSGDKYNNYASKHSPWVQWQGTGENRLPIEVNQPFTNFPKDFNDLPDVSFVIPNMDDDMHNGIFNPIIKKGDTWLKDNIDNYVQWAKDNNSLLIVTFDEDNRFHDNHITTIFTGPMVKPGIYNEKINHFNVLRTLEDMFKLPYIGESKNVIPITDCWNNK